jgi:ABC-type glycerol-3-phosphate transport system substrate-binding protein
MQLWMDGRIGMFMIGRWQYPTYNQITGFEWDVRLPPIGPSGRWAAGGGAGFCLMKPSKVPDAAWELLAWMTGEGQKEVADVIGIPSYKPATQSPTYRVSKPANDKVFVDLAEKYTKLQSMHPKDAEVSAIISRERTMVAEGQRTVQEAARRISEEGTALIQGTPWRASA